MAKFKLRSASRVLSLFTMLLTAVFTTHTPAFAQADATVEGTVASSSRNTLTVRSEAGQYQLYVFRPTTRKPADLPVGARVRVYSTPGDEPGVRIASDVVVMQPPAAGQQESAPGDQVPAEVRRIESGIERQARRLQLGVRAGVAVDPELLLFGAQVQFGPFFTPDLHFRPNIEFAFGEVTSLVALNPEFIYRLPLSSREGRWSTYLGAGPGFNFTNQSFSRNNPNGSTVGRIDFDNFESDIGFNIIGGIRYRSGMFMELKTSVYSEPSPTLRMIIGYSF